MRILMLAGHPPGRGSGSSVRGAVTLEALRSLGEVHPVAFALEGEAAFADPATLLIPRPAPSSPARRLAATLGRGSFFLDERRGRLLEQVRRHLAEGGLPDRYDLVWAHSSLVARVGLDAVEAGRRVLDIDNVAGAEMLTGARTLRRVSARRAYRTLDGRATGREERRRCEAYDQVVLTSAEERDRLGDLRTPVAIVPNTLGSEAEPTAPGEAPPRLLFVGSLHYEPNVDAVAHLLADILPSVRASSPDVQVTVAGRRPAPVVERMCREAGVQLVADAPSLDPLYRGARVVVAPMRLGGGTRIKLLEAMAYGAAIVATEAAAEGLALVDGVNARVAPTPEQFAASCAELLADPGAAARLGREARETWHRRYRPEAARKAVVALAEGSA